MELFKKKWFTEYFHSNGVPFWPLPLISTMKFLINTTSNPSKNSFLALVSNILRISSPLIDSTKVRSTTTSSEEWPDWLQGIEERDWGREPSNIRQKCRIHFSLSQSLTRTDDWFELCFAENNAIYNVTISKWCNITIMTLQHDVTVHFLLM